MRLARIALEDEARDARDLAEVTAAELREVEPRQDVALDVGGDEQLAERPDAPGPPS